MMSGMWTKARCSTTSPAAEEKLSSWLWRDSVIPNTIEEAKTGELPLWKEYFDALRAKGYATESAYVNETCNKGLKGLKDESDVTRASNKIDQYSKACYSVPWLRPFINAWMIDITWGDENPFSDDHPSENAFEEEGKNEALLGLLEDGKKDEFVEFTGGPLMAQVTKFLAENGFSYTDCGSGGQGGHVGIPCTDETRDTLMTLVHHKFAKAIRAGMLFVKVAWFKPYLMYSHEAKERLGLKDG